MGSSHVHIEGMFRIALFFTQTTLINTITMPSLNMIDHTVLVAVREPTLGALIGPRTKTNHLTQKFSHIL